MSDSNFLSEFIKEDIYLVGQAPVTKKQYLIVTPNALSTTETAFLHKIFKAVDVTPEKLIIAHQDSELENYHAIFYFGAEPSNITFTHYGKYIEQDKPVVVAHSLSEIAADNSKKRKLWTALQDCFS